MIELTIDTKTVEAEAGETVLQVALRNGIEIPHFCYHPCLSIAGNCRICLVKVDGRPKLMPSCNVEVTPGMQVITDSQEVEDARHAVMRFITLNHPVDCGICDKAGECRLQDFYDKYGETEPVPGEPKHQKRKLYDLSPRITLDNERCILCGRCVRFTREISQSHQLGILGRGSHARVSRLEGRPFDDPYSDNVVDICPTGALLSKSFLYKSRVWYLEPVRSVCCGCSRGCSVKVWRRKKQWYFRSLGEEKNRTIYRVTAAPNPEINGDWICNKGYDLHKFMDRPRALQPMIAGKPVTSEEALTAATRLIASATNPAALISSHASNEELQAFKAAFGSRILVYTRQDYAPVKGEVLEDSLLIKSDKNPNSYGMNALFPSRPYNRSAGHDLLLVWGDQVDYHQLRETKLVHLASFESRQEQPADVLIPVSTYFERSGSFTNFEGKVNRFEKVLEKPKQALHAREIFGRLGS